MLDFQTSNTVQYILIHPFSVAVMMSFIILHFISYMKGNLIEKISNYKPMYWIMFLTGIMLVVFFSFDGTPEQFINFKF